MGASSSTDNPATAATHEQESLAAASLPLPLLRAVFSSRSSDLPSTLAFPPASFHSPPDHFHDLLAALGPTIAALFFSPAASSAGDGDWLAFLTGFNACCARARASLPLAHLLRVYAAACAAAGAPCGVRFQPDDDKVVGELAPAEIAALLSMCWAMAWSGSAPTNRGADEGAEKAEPVLLPDVSSLVLSALVSAGAVADDAAVWGWDVSGAADGKGVTAQEFTSWAISTVPGLGSCLSRYVQDRFRSCQADPAKGRSVSAGNTTSDASDVYLLTRGRAWAISLSVRNALSEKFLSASVIGMDTEDLLYRSSAHGRGLSRFWSCVEGYKGPALILLSAFGGGENVDADQRWGIGVLTEQGFENKDTFYGSSGFLCATYPIFRMLLPSGTEKSIMYCHLHTQLKTYEAKPKPLGLAFGGSIGNERIFIDEDFSKVTVRHHAVDKTYQHGSLIPNQGYLPVVASILDVEVWGLGGQTTKHQQDVYKKREDIFSGQRRKIDLAAFGNWEDSPEKMMMDMVSDPNRNQREER